MRSAIFPVNNRQKRQEDPDTPPGKDPFAHLSDYPGPVPYMENA